MPESKANPMDRREFLQAGVAASAAAATLAPAEVTAAADGEKPGGNKPVLPTRVLGKTGVEVTMLNQGTVGEPASLGRLLRFAYSEGVRYFDTAEGYGTPRGSSATGSRPSRRSARRSSWRPRATSARPADMLKKIDERLAAARDRLHRPPLLPRARARPRPTGPRARR